MAAAAQVVAHTLLALRQRLEAERAASKLLRAERRRVAEGLVLVAPAGNDARAVDRDTDGESLLWTSQ
jgi:hypothetical protein